MTGKLLSIGKIGSIALAALILTALFSTTETATAQMMMQQHEMNHSMFNVMGMSMVQDVRISGVSITGDNTVSVNLTYTGNGTSPGVTIVAMTNHIAMMMGMMMGSGGMMSGGGFPGMMMGPGMMNPQMMMPGMMNNSAFPGMMMGPGMMNPQMMMGMAGSQTGSATVNSSWQSGSSTTLVLEGYGSAHNASDICVMVFPHLT
jgi:hypothetical protein